MKHGFSMNTEAIKKRIQRLPKKIGDTLETSSKKDALRFIKNYREGIRNNTFGLEPLQPATIKRKQRKGYARPESPLYGLGMDGRRTYTSSIRPYKTKKGWRVNVLNIKHHEADATVKTLFHIHEYGAVIHTSRAVIRIPARPAFKRAYDKTLLERSAEDPAEKVKAAIDGMMKGKHGKAH
ncbi:MAG: hypothetical protein LBP19_05300 [Treponema sp.]|jgi:hypothetical protein|nr:hypothetical protein [Treponema sp.]